jgi:hypothetical protein
MRSDGNRDHAFAARVQHTEYCALTVMRPFDALRCGRCEWPLRMKSRSSGA